MPRYRFDVFELDTDSRRLWKAGVEIELQPRPSRVLEVLLSSPGRVWRREELFAAAWPRMVVTDSALTQAVFELRKAMGEEARRVIRTVARSGYALDVPVQVLAPGVGAPHGAPVATAPVPAAVPEAPVAPARPHRVRAALLLVLGLAVVVLLTMSAGPSGRPPGPIVDRLVVMPRGAGIEGVPWLETGLARVLGRELGIVAGAEAVAAGGAAGDSELRLRYVLEGAAGERRVAIEWALSRGGRVTRAGLERGATGELVDLTLRIGSALGRGGSDRGQAIPEEALRAFGDGAEERGAFRLAEARRHFERALAIAPSFVHARAELADLLWLQGFRELARAEASRALDDLARSDGDAPSRLRADLLVVAGLQREAAADYSALAELPGADPQLRFPGAMALLRGGDPAAARRMLDAVSPTALPARSAARWHLVDEALSAQRQDHRAALDAALRALQSARAARDPWTEGRALASIAERRWRLGDAAGAAEAVAEAAQALAPLGESELALQVRFFDLWVRSAQGTIDERDIEGLRRRALDIGNPDLEARVDMLRGARAEREGRYVASRDAFRSARETYRRLGDASGERVARFNAAVQDLALGDLDAATPEFAAIAGLPPIAALPLQLVAKVHAAALHEGGHYEPAEALLDEAIAAAVAQQAPLARTLRCLRGRVRVSRGAWEPAASDFDACGAPHDAPIDDPEDLVAEANRALLAARRGAGRDAAARLGRASAASATITGDGSEDALAELALVAALVDAGAARAVVATALARPSFAGPSRHRAAVLVARCRSAAMAERAAACERGAVGLRPELARLAMWLEESSGGRIADER